MELSKDAHAEAQVAAFTNKVIQRFWQVTKLKYDIKDRDVYYEINRAIHDAIRELVVKTSVSHMISREFCRRSADEGLDISKHYLANKIANFLINSDRIPIEKREDFNGTIVYTLELPIIALEKK